MGHCARIRFYVTISKECKTKHMLASGAGLKLACGWLVAGFYQAMKTVNKRLMDGS